MTTPAHDRRRRSGEDGFTIVEVMAAMVIMIIGVLGTFTLLEGSMSSTARTTAREQGTNLARDLIERSRQFAFSSMTMVPTAAIPASATNPGAPATPGAPAVLRASLPASDNATAITGTPPNSTFDVTRRNTTYTVKIFACSVDDPSDGAGQGDSTFCKATTGTKGPGTPSSVPAASVNVLGIQVNAGGSLLQTVCNAVGTDTTILNTLTSAVNAVAPLSACTSGGGTGNGTVAYDNTPDDMRRIRVDVTWTKSGSTSTVSQTTLLTNPLQT